MELQRGPYFLWYKSNNERTLESCKIPRRYSTFKKATGLLC